MIEAVQLVAMPLTIFRPMMWAWTSPEAYCSEVPAPAALVMPNMAEPAAARELMRTILTMQRNEKTAVRAKDATLTRGGRAGTPVYLYPKPSLAGHAMLVCVRLGVEQVDDGLPVAIGTMAAC
jgi:hypothetical protein